MGLAKTSSAAVNLLIDIGYFPGHVNLDLLKLNLPTDHGDEILSAAESLLSASTDLDEVWLPIRFLLKTSTRVSIFLPFWLYYLAFGLGCYRLIVDSSESTFFGVAFCKIPNSSYIMFLLTFGGKENSHLYRRL